MQVIARDPAGEFPAARPAPQDRRGWKECQEWVVPGVRMSLALFRQKVCAMSGRKCRFWRGKRVFGLVSSILVGLFRVGGAGVGAIEMGLQFLKLCTGELRGYTDGDEVWTRARRGG